jgi:hypothetical protein
VGEEPFEGGELVYLDLDEALEIYAAIIGSTAAEAGDHLRGRQALEGSLGRPVSYAHYGRRISRSRVPCSHMGSPRHSRSSMGTSALHSSRC